MILLKSSKPKLTLIYNGKYKVCRNGGLGSKSLETLTYMVTGNVLRRKILHTLNGKNQKYVTMDINTKLVMSTLPCPKLSELMS